MMSESDLSEIERRNYLSYFDDGIADLVAGLLVLGFALGVLFDAGMFVIFAIFPLIFYVPLKRSLTLPRMGYVKFSPQRRKKISMNLILTFVAGTLTLLLGIVSFLGFEGQGFDIRDFFMEYGDLIFGALMALPFILIGILFDFRRLIGYAVLVFAAWLFAYLFDVHPGITVTIAGTVISAIGLGILVRFLNSHPRPTA